MSACLLFWKKKPNTTPTFPAKDTTNSMKMPASLFMRPLLITDRVFCPDAHCNLPGCNLPSSLIACHCRPPWLPLTYSPSPLVQLVHPPLPLHCCCCYDSAVTSCCSSHTTFCQLLQLLSPIRHSKNICEELVRSVWVWAAAENNGSCFGHHCHFRLERQIYKSHRGR